MKAHVSFSSKVGSMRLFSRRLILGLVAAAVAGVAFSAIPVAEAQVFSSAALHQFAGAPNDGFGPTGTLIADSSGNLYGTTQTGGTSNLGTVFELVSSSGTYQEKILYNFTGSPDGSQPYAGLVMDSLGNLYGTTTLGGTSNVGTAFELVNSSGTYTEKVLFSFAFADGSSPNGSLIIDSSGNLYGTAAVGGSNRAGNVFELVNSSGTYTEKVLYSFAGSPDGNEPLSSLITDSSGNLYGTTYQGGAHNFGTVFELVNSSGTYSEKVLYSFVGLSGDGGNPYAPVLMDAAGNLYGTTIGGGLGQGTVFELVNSAGTYTEKILHTFTNPGDGASPYAGLVADTSGNLYGTTSSGITSSGGAVFELVNSSGSYTEKVIYTFSFSSITTSTCAMNGAYPVGGLLIDAAGNLYGTTSETSGEPFAGLVFELGPFSGTPSSTTTAVISSANPATAGDPLTFTATVTPSSIFTPTGTISFSNPSMTVGSATMTCGIAQLTVPAEAVGIGTATVTAQYTPDTPAFSSSSGMLSQTIHESGVALTNGNNTFNGNQTVNGTVSATSFTGNGSGLTTLNPANLSPGTAAINIAGNAATATAAATATSAMTASNALALAGTPPSGYAVIGANKFTGAQSMPSADVSGETATGSIAIGGGTPIKEYVSVTLSVDVPGLAPNSCTTFKTASLTGFTPGTSDTIAMGIPASLHSGLSRGVFLVWQAWETETNESPTITVQACNASGAALKAGSSGVIRLDVFKH